MSNKAPYRTRQMTELLTFLKSVPGRHVTVNDISEHFKQMQISVGTTTIYRHLEKMVNEGLVAKYIVDGTSSACFAYIGNAESAAKQTCYHCKCERCGKVIHLQCNEVAVLQQHLAEHHNFQMNPLRTVFYGICSECRNSMN